MLNQTLIEAVDSMPDGELLYIGSATSYFFIGTKHEFYTDISRIKRAYLNRLTSLSIGAWLDLNRVLRRGIKTDPPSEYNTMKKYKSAIDDAATKYAADIRTATTRVENADKALERFNYDFEHRTVTDIYKRDTCNPGTVILVTGTEGSRGETFWFKHEYDKARDNGFPFMRNV